MLLMLKTAYELTRQEARENKFTRKYPTVPLFNNKGIIQFNWVPLETPLTNNTLYIFCGRRGRDIVAKSWSTYTRRRHQSTIPSWLTIVWLPWIVSCPSERPNLASVTFWLVSKLKKMKRCRWNVLENLTGEIAMCIYGRAEVLKVQWIWRHLLRSRLEYCTSLKFMNIPPGMHLLFICVIMWPTLYCTFCLLLYDDISNRVTALFYLLEDLHRHV